MNSPPSDNLVRLPRAPSLASDDCRLFVESVTDYAMFLLDPEGHVTTWNKGAQAIEGYSADEILGRHFSRFYPPEDVSRGRPQEALHTARTFGRVEDDGWRVRKDGTRFWANVVITAIRNEAGELRGFGKVTRDLTAKRAAEERLRESEQRFHHLIEAVIDYAIFLLDAEGNVSTWNAGARRLKGYGDDEIVGKHFSRFYCEEDRASGKPGRLLDIVRREGRVEDEGWRVRKDGTRFWANVVITALRDEQGKLLGFAKVTRDLTERRKSEEELRKSERQLLAEQVARSAAEEAKTQILRSEERYRALSERLRVIFEGVADSIMAEDAQGRVVFANTSAAQLFGFESPEAMMGADRDVVSSRFEVFDEADRPLSPSQRPVARVLAGAESGSAVLHLRDRESGQGRWVFARASKVSGGGGEPELVILIWHDVTTERRQERQARFLAEAANALSGSLDEHEMLRALVAALVPILGDWCSVALLKEGRLETAVVSSADEHHLATARAVAERLFATKELMALVRAGGAEILTIDERWAPCFAESHAGLPQVRGTSLVAPLTTRGQPLGVILFFSEGEAARYDWSSIAVAQGLGDRASVAIENARLYAEAQSAARRAEEASRAKDEFLATVSHELRTPLSAILGWARLLKDRVTDLAVRKPIDVIHRNAEAQAKIIDDILDVSRVITGKFRVDVRPIDLVPVVRDALEVVRPSAVAKHIELEFRSQHDFCLLVADSDRLQQAVWNLLSNAVKFTSDGKITITLKQQGSQIVLSVRDTGSGIESAFLPFVFDRFQQADASTTRKVGGLGLGLALVKHIVELHGGQVSATSPGPGLGSTFTITLPVRAIAPSSEPTATALDSTSRRGALSGLRILVVDDDDDARDLIREALADQGATIAGAESAEAAFRLVRTFLPDALVSDISMPGEDGYSLIERIRALPEDEGGAVPALALTAFARREDGARAMAAGYTRHVGKPVDPNMLVALLAEISRRGRAPAR